MSGDDARRRVARLLPTTRQAECADGYVGISTWNALLDGATDRAVFDNDGNGRVDPYEIPYGE